MKIESETKQLHYWEGGKEYTGVYETVGISGNSKDVTRKGIELRNNGFRSNGMSVYKSSDFEKASYYKKTVTEVEEPKDDGVHTEQGCSCHIVAPCPECENN